jgi:hypothetical protein
MVTIQKQTSYQENIVDNHLWLINDVKGETLKEVAIYLKNRGIPFGYLPDFLKNPGTYPGNKITGLKQITERFLNITISKYYKKKAERLPVKFVFQTIMKILFQEA